MDCLLFTAGHIQPEIDVWGNRQTFYFDQHTSSLTLQNAFAPIQSTPALLNLELVNYLNDGFRIQHKTNTSDSYGSLDLSTFLNSGVVGSSILTMDSTGFHFKIRTEGQEPLVPSDFSTKNYVDITSVKSVTAGTGLYGGVIDAPFRQHGIIGIDDVGIAARVYNWPISLDINAQGQVLHAIPGDQPFTVLNAGYGIEIDQVPGEATIIAPPPDITFGTTGQLDISRINGAGLDGTWLNGGGYWNPIQFSDLIGLISPDQIDWLSIPPQKIEGYPSAANVFLSGIGLWETPTFTITADFDFGGYNVGNIAILDAGEVVADQVNVNQQLIFGSSGVAINAWPGYFNLQQTDPLHSDVLIPNRQIHMIFNGQLVAVPCNIL